MLKAIKRTWRWSSLRAIGNLPATKLTIFIPLIGYMLIFNEKLLPYLQLSQRIFGGTGTFDDGAHVSWRLLFIYFGLCILAVGSIIYQIFCPAECKRFGSVTDYIAATRTHMGDIALGRMEAKLAAEASTMEAFVQIRDHTADRVKRYPVKADRDQIYENYWPDVLGMYFDFLDATKPILRAVTFAFYGLGLLVLAVPSIDVFLKIAVVAFKVATR